MAPGADILGTDTWEAYAGSSTQKNQQQQLLAICSSDSRQVSAQYSRGIAEGIGDVWVQRRRALALEDGMSEPLLGLNQRDHSRRHAGVGYQQGAGHKGDFVPAKVQFVLVCSRAAAVSAGTVPHNVRIGVSFRGR
jgi:hypothetical protein